MLRKIGLLVMILHYWVAFGAVKPNQKVGDGKPSAQASQPDKRGTEASPLVVNERTVHSDQEAAEEAAKDAEQKRVNRWNIGLTLAIAICALLQFCGVIGQIVVYLKQTKIMRETLNAISTQADTMADQVEQMGIQTDILSKSVLIAETAQRDAISKERPRLSIEIKDFDLGRIPAIHYKLTCHGTTPAYVNSSWEMTDFSPISDFEWVTEAYGFPLRGLPDVIPNGTTENEVFIMGTDREKTTKELRDKAVHNGERYIHFRVRIVYRDIFEGEHQLLFSKVYGLPPMSNSIYGMLGLSSRFPEWRDSIYKYEEVT
jgi:hypothetical protein